MANDKPMKVVNPTSSNKVTIAFPFSNIKIAEPTEQVRALATLVADLAERLAKVDPSVEADMLVDRAHALTSQLD